MGKQEPMDEITEIESYFKQPEKIKVGSDQLLSALNHGFTYMLYAELERTKLVTEVLDNYKTQQASRNTAKGKKQNAIFIFLMVLVGVLTLSLVGAICCILFFKENVDAKSLAGIISSCVTYLTAILTIFIVIVKYIFPSDEEKNFNDLVMMIIENDTARIKSQYDYIIKNQSLR